MPPRAIVKFGSTSAILLVAEHLQHPTVYQQELIDVFSPGGPEALIKVAQSWREDLRRRGIEALAAGGEAIRRNAGLEARLRALFPHWWHLTGEMEGRLAWIAVKAGDSLVDGVVDIGGGSTEIITADGTWSFSIGAARFTEAHVSWPPLTDIAHPAFIGGTAVSLARWAGRDRLTLREVRAMQQALLADPQQFREWSPLRRRILPQGLAILAQLLEHGGWPTFTVSTRGLTEGLWLAASLGRVHPS